MNYQSAEIVGITKPEFDGTAEDFIVYIARVSNPNNEKNFSTSGKLLEYCIREGHWSPFEHVYVTMKIETTRDISRQILRHRSFTFQEYSGRYAKMFGFVEREARVQDKKNRQNSNETDDAALIDFWSATQKEVIDFATKRYDEALQRGIAKEQARAILPEGNTLSSLYMTGSIRSFIHYVQARTNFAGSKGAQKEHRLVAEMIWTSLKTRFPIITHAVEETWKKTKEST